MDPTDRDVSDRFERRYAAIDAEIPPPPAFPLAAPRMARGTRRNVLALVALVVVGLAIPAIGLRWTPLVPQASGLVSPDASGEPNATPLAIPDVPFPVQIDGFPVISASHAADLLANGQLNGRAVAVSGYYDATYPSCPYPGRYIGPLETWCSVTAFADTKAAARVCDPIPNGRTCHGPQGPSISPFWMPETSGSLSEIFSGHDTAEPLPMILIGHAGDPRQWRCTAEMQDACAHAFVVDRIAWALGSEIQVNVSGFVDPGTDTAIQLFPKLTLEQVMSKVGLRDVVAAAVFRAGHVSFIDPRWSMSGDNLVWIVRTAGVGVPPSREEGLEETMWLIDDATGAVIDTHALALDDATQPARVWLSATVHGYDCCAGDVSPFARVTSPGGDVMFEGSITGGAQGADGYTTFGGGYGSVPLVLAAGEFTVTAWVGTYGAGLAGRHAQECSGPVRLSALDSVTVMADFPVGQACSIATGPATTSAP